MTKRKQNKLLGVRVKWACRVSGRDQSGWAPMALVGTIDSSMVGAYGGHH